MDTRDRSIMRVLRFRRLSSLFTIAVALAVLLSGTMIVTPTSQVKALSDQWEIACSESPSSEDNYLFGVAAQADDAVVAVGSKRTSGNYKPLIERWEPTSSGPPCFQERPTPNPPLPGNSELFGVARVPSGSPSKITFWAVGYQGGTTRTWDPAIGDWIIGGGAQPLIEYSTDAGKTWNIIQELPSVPGDAVLKGVAARNEDDVRAVGYTNDGSGARTLALHLINGVWRTVETFNEPGDTENYLYGVSIADKTFARAVGFALRDSTPTPNLMQHWDVNTQRWEEDQYKPVLGPHHYLFGVTDMLTTIPGEPHVAYAVGQYVPQGTSDKRAQALKWKGEVIL